MCKLIFFESTKNIKLRKKYNITSEIFEIGDLNIYIPKRIYLNYIHFLEIKIKNKKIVYGKNKRLDQLIFKHANRNELEKLSKMYNFEKLYNYKAVYMPFSALDSFYNSIKNTWEKYFIIDLDNYERIEEKIA